MEPENNGEEQYQNNEEEQYLVMWHTWQPVQKRGVWNRLLGRKVRLFQPMIHSYDSLEVAEIGYTNIKHNLGYKPCILRVVKS